MKWLETIVGLMEGIGAYLIWVHGGPWLLGGIILLFLSYSIMLEHSINWHNRNKNYG